jgi:two-component system sensor histidine kinase RpfC
MVDPAIDYHLRGDPHHLRQVLLNLLANGIKFTERGSINVGVTLAAETDDAIRLRFEVRDTGIGINEGARSRIFEQFVQADDSTTRRYGGTGLGTTIAKQLVHLMGGTIGVSSEVGVGSTFWFEVPLLKIAASRDYAAPAYQVEPSAALLVADEQAALRLQPMVAEACGTVEIVASATLVAAQLRVLRQRGIAVPAVLVSGDIETACRVFETVAAERIDDATALIYVSPIAPSDADAARLQSIAGVNYVHPDASPRILRNAIHAATTHETRESAEIIDLGHVLKQQRQPLRILVAEDNLTNQAIIKQLLESAGHTVLLASDGEEALDVYEQDLPELAILDFNMPERNGLEVVSAIRMMEPAGTRLPVIILSASVTVEARDNARSAGADDFVGKPYDAANLLQVVDRLVRRAGRGQPSRARHAPAVPVSIAPLLDELRLREVEKIASGSAFLTELLRGFCIDVEMLLLRLDNAIAKGEIAVIRDVTHAIKGAALSIGAQQLGARCAPIDDAAAGRQLAQLKNQAADLRACYDRTVAQISAYAMQRHRVSL